MDCYPFTLSLSPLVANRFNRAGSAAHQCGVNRGPYPSSGPAGPLRPAGFRVYRHCHKWLCAPKGSAFLYARPEVQAWLEPLVVSWGWEDETFVPDPMMGDTRFTRYYQWQGTRDIAAFLSVPTAIQFQQENHWEEVRAACHALALETRQRINVLTGLPAISPDSTDWVGQMVTVRLPPVDIARLKRQLYDQYRIEVPLLEWSGQPFMRISFQGYNTREDADALVTALTELL